jgi:hypothetical protein
MECLHCNQPDDPAAPGGDQPEHVAHVRLLIGCERETLAFAECGCHLTQEEDGDVALFQCPTHDTAPALLLRLEELWTVIGEAQIDGMSTSDAIDARMEQTRVAIAKAKGA